MTFEEFFRASYPDVVRSMRLVVGDPVQAEESSQEAFVRALRHWRRVSRLDRPVAWVYVVACNDARKAWRREGRRRAAAEDTGAVADDAAGTVITALQVRAALAALTDRQRGAVVLRYVADLPLAEIAEVMGCATGTVKATLHQALGRMRVEIEANDDAS